MKKKVLWFYAILLVLLVLGIFYDSKLAVFLANNRTNFFNGLMNIFSFMGEGMIIFILTTIIFLLARKGKKLAFLWLSIIISAIITQLLKLIIMRHRPDVALSLDSSFSFPSGHATAVFSVLAVIIREIPWLKWFWLVFAVVVAFSRLYLGMHYLTDVVAGALIGFTTGLLIVKYERKIIGFFRRLLGK